MISAKTTNDTYEQDVYHDLCCKISRPINEGDKYVTPSSYNRFLVQNSSTCACYHCLQVFPSTQVIDNDDWALQQLPLVCLEDGIALQYQWMLDLLDDDELAEFRLGGSSSTWIPVTACCPKCCVDSVIPDNVGLPITDAAFLRAAQKAWFNVD